MWLCLLQPIKKEGWDKQKSINRWNILWCLAVTGWNKLEVCNVDPVLCVARGAMFFCQIEGQMWKVKKMHYWSRSTKPLVIYNISVKISVNQWVFLHWPVIIRQSLWSRASVKRRETMSSGLIRKRISSWTRPELVTPPPTNWLAKSTYQSRQYTLLIYMSLQNLKICHIQMS